jgi:hypothetical protein
LCVALARITRRHHIWPTGPIDTCLLLRLTPPVRITGIHQQCSV